MTITASPTSSSSSSAATTTTRRRQENLYHHHRLLLEEEEKNENENKEPKGLYALYSLPPFTVTFTSSYNTNGLPTDFQERSQLLTATLHSPLRLITTEFLLESFHIQISKTTTGNNTSHRGTNFILHEQQQQDGEESETTAATIDQDTQNLHDILDSFMTIDLQVAVRAIDHLALDESNNNHNAGRRRRHLLRYNNNHRLLDGTKAAGTAAAGGGSGGGQARDYHFPTTGGTTFRTSPSSSTSSTELLQFEADFFTTAAFLEPPRDNMKPTNKEVADLLGGWIHTTFDDDQSLYVKYLVNSDVGVLQHMEQIHIETDSGAVFDPYATGTIIEGKDPTKGLSSSTSEDDDNDEDGGASTDAGSAAKSPPSTTTESTIGAWSPSEKLFFTLLVMVSILSIAGLLLALKKFRGRNKELARMLESEFSHNGGGGGTPRTTTSNNDDFNTNTVLSGRHSDEIMDILNASDRYLAEHRPDLLEAMQRASPSSSSRNLVIPIVHNGSEDDYEDECPAGSQRPIERRYVTATNPFSYLYGASYFHSQKQAVEQDQQRKRNQRRRRQDPMDGVELDPESVPDDEDLDMMKQQQQQTSDQAVSGFLQNWFQQVVGTRRAEADAAAAAAGRTQTKPAGDHQEEFGLVDPDMEDLIIEECMAQNTIMACDEDPSQYDFAYQDFPRQDGTPCLIYEETLNEEEEEQYLKNSHAKRESLHSTTSYGGVHDPLTDDEFQRALSQHNAFDYLYGQQNSSFEREATDSSLIEFEDVDTTNTTTTTDVNKKDALFKEEETDPDSAFTDKLERLVAMRHRHYEKQRIVEKHREQRRQERAKQRAEKQKAQQEENQKRDLLLRRHTLELDIQELEATTAATNQGPPSGSAAVSSKVVTPTDTQGNAASGHHHVQASWHQQQAELRQLQKPNLHRRTSSEADAGLPPTLAAAAAATGGRVIQPNRSMDLEETGGATTTASTRSDPPKRLVQSARKPLPPVVRTSYNTDVFRPIDQPSPLSTCSNASAGKGRTNMTLPPTNLQSPPVVSPQSSMTDTGSTPSSAGSNSNASTRSTPPLMMGTSSIRDGSSARKKKLTISSASAALAKGFQARRSMSFGNLEEKKMDDDNMQTIGCDSSTNSRRLPPQRSLSSNRHKRTGSNSSDIMLHGIYAQFAS